ncbi:MAG: bifunctional transaldolase/phosoglucose isomerase [Candidatus Omnitrophota bacterium]|nr:bifunctional transaldolase/phosoglucose isomerase [Candidatus Omnitrophota bacterium]
MSTMTATRVPTTKQLAQAGQSPWLDNISRELLSSGKLKALIEKQGLLGVTSNPTIFEKAINKQGGGYERDIRRLLGKGAGILQIYDALTIKDIRAACDLFLPVFKDSKGEHGFVSLEVRPDLADNTARSVEEGRRLFREVGRPNVMIKIPATSAGLPAVKALIGQGINVNVTLMFSMKHYQDVANVYIEGLEQFKDSGGDLSRVHSVASVFVSRIDSLVDKQLDVIYARETDAEQRAEIDKLRGKVAVSNSRLIYHEFKDVFGSGRFRALQERGATIQKVLWGSTSAKNPKYHDLLYVEPLIGPETVNTMPTATLEAFLDHGEVCPNTVAKDIDDAGNVIEQLKTWGIDLIDAGEKLQYDGVISFTDSFDSLIKSLEMIREKSKGAFKPGKMTVTLPKVKNQIRDRIVSLDKERICERIFERDPSVWKPDAKHRSVIANRLGWLEVADWILGRLYELDELSADLRREGVKDIVLLGMGGSSLAPEVISAVCRCVPSFPRFQVVDTTDAGTISKLNRRLNLKRTAFIVASKSGGTVETMAQLHYFYDSVAKAIGSGADQRLKTGRHFIAITDEDSSLQRLARERAFRKIFLNPSDIGGRYSALSFFGIVPGSLMGADVRGILRSARGFYAQSQSASKVQNNPGVNLGVILGELALQGRDKLTFVSSKSLRPFEPWLEQLIAESTGKEGKGIIPVVGEEARDPAQYANDRFFVVIKLKGDPVAEIARRVRALKKAGFPVLELEWKSRLDIGAEFLRWEVATAAASAVLGINPFDEPNVKESKDNTARLLTHLSEKGKLDDPEELTDARGKFDFAKFFYGLNEGAYAAMLAYTERSPQVQKALGRIQKKISVHFKVPALLGFGPRYLHSIGQLYKGGPHRGYFVLFLTRDAGGLKIPDTDLTFEQLKRAQALGDYEALTDREKPLLVVDLGKNALGGIAAFEKRLTAYLKD